MTWRGQLPAGRRTCQSPPPGNLASRSWVSQSVCVLRENRSRSSSLVKRLAPCKGTEFQNHHFIRTSSYVLHRENRSHSSSLVKRLAPHVK